MIVGNIITDHNRKVWPQYDGDATFGPMRISFLRQQQRHREDRHDIIYLVVSNSAVLNGFDALYRVGDKRYDDDWAIHVCLVETRRQ